MLAWEKQWISCRVELGGLAGVLIFDDISGVFPSAVVITAELYLGKDCCNPVELELCLSGCRLILLVRIHALRRVTFISLPLSVRSESGANVYRLETTKP